MEAVKVFWENPYLTELTAQVTSVDRSRITLNKTIAYAFSGGQESDYGTINGYAILCAEKHDKQIVYQLNDEHSLRVGDEAAIKIDWNRRYKLMRLHFAAELVLELITQRYNHPLKIGAHIAEDKARVDFAWQGNISETFAFLEQEIKQIVADDRPIKSAFCDAEKEVRYWEIEGFARVLCGGTHIRKTGEIGTLAFRRNNIGKGKERIEIYLAET